MKTLTKQEQYEYSRLEFLYQESQISDKEYITELENLLGKEHIKRCKVLTGMYDGHYIEEITIINISNLPEDDDEY